MSYWRFMAILRILASVETGLTVGQLQQRIPAMTRFQAEKALKYMIGEGDVIKEVLPYRPNINKNVYHISDQAIGKLRGIVETYDSRYKQLGILQE